MLDVKIKDLLNQQINKEFYSAYLYLAFSNYFSERNLSGFSNWYRIQGLQHERYVTDLIHTIYDAAYSVKDFRTMQFLDWFVKEQGEEEKNAEDLLKKMELFGGDPKSLYLLDQELAARTYAAPSLVL